MSKLFAAAVIIGACWNPHITISMLEKMVYGVNQVYVTMSIAAEESGRKQERSH